MNSNPSQTSEDWYHYEKNVIHAPNLFCFDSSQPIFDTYFVCPFVAVAVIVVVVLQLLLFV